MFHGCIASPGKVSQNIHLVRFEDFASHPWKASKKILNFLGLSPNTYTYTFLQTHMANAKGQGRGAHILDTVVNPWAAVRNWRHRIKMPAVSSIQAECSQMMSVLGYKMISTEEELLNVKEYNATGDFKYNEF